MPIVIDHSINPFVLGLGAFRAGTAPARRANRMEDIRQREALGQSIGQGISQIGNTAVSSIMLRARLQGAQGLQGQRDAAALEREQVQQDAATQRAVAIQQAIAQRQQQQIAAQQVQAATIRDAHVQSLPPAVKSEYLTNQQRINSIMLDNSIPDDQKQLMTERMKAINNAILEQNPPPKPPTTDELFSQQVRIRPDLGMVFVRDQDRGFRTTPMRNGVSFEMFSNLVDAEIAGMPDEFTPRGALFPATLTEDDKRRIATQRVMERMAEFNRISAGLMGPTDDQSAAAFGPNAMGGAGAGPPAASGLPLSMADGRLGLAGPGGGGIAPDAFAAIQQQAESAGMGVSEGLQQVQQSTEQAAQELLAAFSQVQEGGGSLTDLEAWRELAPFGGLVQKATEFAQGYLTLAPMLPSEQKIQMAEPLNIARFLLEHADELEPDATAP